MNYTSEHSFIQLHFNLAVSHPDLLHSANKKAFFGDDEREFLKDSASANDYVMLLDLPNGSLSGDNDAVIDKINAGFFIVGRASKKNFVDYRDLESVSDKAKKIGIQCIMRILYLAEERIDCDAAIAPFNPRDVKYTKVWFAEGWVGYRFSYPFITENIIEYEEDIWQ
jgi:hypothetical protein